MTKKKFIDTRAFCIGQCDVGPKVRTVLMAKKSLTSPELDLDENNFLIAVVDDVVLYAHQPGVRNTSR